MWFHLPQWHNISHNKGHYHSDITSVTETTSSGKNVVLTSDTTRKNWQQHLPTPIIWQLQQNYIQTTTKSNNIMKNIILKSPSKPGVLPRKTFSHTPDEARSVGLAKACVFFFQNIYSVIEKLDSRI